MTEQETIEEIFEYYKGRDDCASQESLVDMFREIQEVYGYIPAELKERMAREFCVKETFLNCIIQRYPSLKEQKITHTVIVCSGERCSCLLYTSDAADD